MKRQGEKVTDNTHTYGFCTSTKVRAKPTGTQNVWIEHCQLRESIRSRERKRKRGKCGEKPTKNEKEKKETKGEHKLFFICKNGEKGENYNSKKKKKGYEKKTGAHEVKGKKDTTQRIVRIVYFE